MGHQVTVLTGFPNHPTGVIPPEYQGERFRRERWDGIDVIRTWLYAAANKGTGRRILNYLSFPTTACLLGLPAIRACDVIVATSPQFFVACAGWVAANVLKRPFVFEVRDLWPDSIEAVGAITNRSVLRGLRAVEEFLYRRASLIVAVAHSTVRILGERGFDTSRMVVLPNGVDLDLFCPGPKENAVRAQHAPKGETLVTYIGTHGMAHSLQTVLESAETLSSRGDIRFLFVGEGAEKDRLMAWASEHQLRNVTFLGQQPREVLPEFYQASDICLVPLRNTPLFQAVLPSKMFEIMGAGRPTLLSVQGEARQLLQAAQAGIDIDPESPQSLCAAILKLAEMPELGDWYGLNGHDYVRKHYTRQGIANRYIQALETVV